MAKGNTTSNGDAAVEAVAFGVDAVKDITTNGQEIVRQFEALEAYISKQDSEIRSLRSRLASSERKRREVERRLGNIQHALGNTE